MKFKKIIREEIDIKTVRGRSHAVSGEIVTERDIYSPCFVLRSYFEPQYIEKYGLDSREILRHGTGYIDCVTVYGQIVRLQSYEYAILADGEAIARKFREKCPVLDRKRGFKYRVGEFLWDSRKELKLDI